MEGVTEFMQSVDVGLVVVVVVEEMELVGGRAEEDEVIMGPSGVTGVVMVSLEFRGGDVVLVTDGTKVTEQAEVTEVDSSPASGTDLVVVDKPDGISDVLVEGEEEEEEDVVMTEIAASGAAAANERIPSGSGKADSVDRCVDAVETGLLLLGAETVSEVVMEGAVIVAELEVTERLGVMDSEEVEVTETVAGGSVGVVELVWVVRNVAVGSSVVVASGMEGLLSGSVTFVGVVAAAVGLTESVHISVSEDGTVLEGEIVKLVESGTEFEIVSTVGVVVAVRAGAAGVDGAAVGLSLVGVFVSPSCI